MTAGASFFPYIKNKTMKKLNTIILILLGMICTQLYAVQLNSIYTLKTQ